MKTTFFLVFLFIMMPASSMAKMLVNMASKYCLDTDGAAVNGGGVRMWGCVSHPNQSWTQSSWID